MARRRLPLNLLFLVIVFCSSSVAALAWGDKGHRIVARIAWANLTPTAQAKIKTLLANDSFFATCQQKQHLPIATNADKFVCIATWADKVRPDRPETSQWHFVDITRDALTYNAVRDCSLTSGGDCVIQEIGRAFLVLNNTNSPARDEALKFLVHFMGDLHQPLHDATDNHDQEAQTNGFPTDKGANLKFVTWLGNPMNSFNDNWELHAVWDTGIIEATDPNEVHLAGVLFGNLAPGDKAFSKLSPANAHWSSSLSQLLFQWAQQGHGLAVSKAYNIGPQDPNDVAIDKNRPYHRYHLGQDYLAANAPVVKRQLQLAGVRLAKLLNEALR